MRGEGDVMQILAAVSTSERLLARLILRADRMVQDGKFDPHHGELLVNLLRRRLNEVRNGMLAEIQ